MDVTKFDWMKKTEPDFKAEFRNFLLNKNEFFFGLNYRQNVHFHFVSLFSVSMKMKSLLF
jgi:hypothetical protein